MNLSVKIEIVFINGSWLVCGMCFSISINVKVNNVIACGVSKRWLGHDSSVTSYEGML